MQQRPRLESSHRRILVVTAKMPSALLYMSDAVKIVTGYPQEALGLSELVKTACKPWGKSVQGYSKESVAIFVERGLWTSFRAIAGSSAFEDRF